MEAEFSIALRNYADEPGDWSWLFDSVAAAEVSGFDRVVISEHIAMGEQLDAYTDDRSGGWSGKQIPIGPDTHFLEPLTLLGYLAAQTTRLRLGTGVLLAALRSPVVLAKTAATLDVLCGGRLDLGVGIGWHEAEYDAVGVPFQSRGKRLDECLEVCQLLWREQAASYSGSTFGFTRLHQMPKPAQPDGVPIWVSGRLNDAVVRRIARFGSGWLPWGIDPDDLPSQIAEMRERVAAHDRDPAQIGVIASLGVVPYESRAQLREAAESLISAGATDVRVPVRIPAGRAAATDYLAEVIGYLRG